VAFADDGRRMSINVEMIGSGLVVQHYVAEIAEKRHCHMVSLSDVLTPQGWTTVQVIWDLRVKAIDAGRCEYTNSVDNPTTDFMALSEAHDASFEDTAASRQQASDNHNRRETPLFARSIERRALGQS
jgi:hypothetical protein